MRIIKIFVFAAALTGILCIGGYGKAADIPEKSFFDLGYVLLQIAGVENDMRLFIQWINEDKNDWLEPAGDALKRLDKIRKKLIAMKLPANKEPLRDDVGACIYLLEKAYIGIYKKSDKELGDELMDYFGAYNHAATRMGEAYGAIIFPPKGKFDLLTHEVSFARNKNDAKDFLKACDLIKHKKMEKARDILVRLLADYENTCFEGSIVNRLVMALEDINGDIVRSDPQDETLKILDKFLDRKQYSPILYKIFVQWRTFNQLFMNGASNWSHIPNEEYDEKRMQIVETIRNYAKNNRQDEWAPCQMVLLMDIPIITRGDPYGNSVLRDWAVESGTLDEITRNLVIKKVLLILAGIVCVLVAGSVFYRMNRAGIQRLLLRTKAGG
ncbi:MAG TPA: hypothetical protein PKY78_09235 [Candidatus Omnitrophota bacterium]|nr:hypothetical protein [Candidatus Omnitrophota bacterium]HPS21150.1 hypothetical protein [Candidatus Omnitrophota bacterium]